MNCAVVIPIYKTIPNESEKESFKQVIKVLAKYQIVLLTHKELDLDYYYQIADINHVNLHTEYFEQSFFEHLNGYNSLCLSAIFYERFLEYEYMLIYQLDAYVFKDELNYWCNKGYDYIGAPWFDDNKSQEEGANLWAVGNGGFSLRRVSTFVNLFRTHKRMHGFKYLYKKSIINRGSLSWFLRSYLFRYENNFQYLLQTWDDAEDIFFCLKLADTALKLKLPSLKEAAAFAFEQSPTYLFEQNNFILPFGCHAWEKYEYESFWMQYMK